MAARAREITGTRPATRSDAYTGLLILSLAAQILGAVFFYLDWSSYSTTKPTVPPAPQISPPAGGGAGGGGAPAGAPGAGAPMGGGAPPMGGGMP